MSRPGFVLEAFKFSLYVALPISALVLVSQPRALDWIVKSRAYVINPPAAKQVSGETFRKFKALAKQQREKAE